MTRFVLLFFCILLVSFSIELTEFGQTMFVIPWTESLAKFCADLIMFFDVNVEAQGKTIIDQQTHFAVSIEAGCNAVEASLILIAAILAFPSTWVHKLWGLSAGILALQILNVVRIISLFYLGQWRLDFFQFAHLYLWQGLIILDVLIVWLVWIRTLTPKDAMSPPTQRESIAS